MSDGTEDNYIDKICRQILGILPEDGDESKLNFVELGTRMGKSATGVHSVFPYMKIITYDNVYDKDVAIKLADKNIRYTQADTRTVKHEGRIDILFCDTLHTAKQLIDEYNNFRQHLHTKSIVIVDDVFLNDKAQGFMSLPGDKTVFGHPVRPSGLGVITSNKWTEAKLNVGESIPPVIANWYERWMRFRKRLKEK